MKRLRLCLSVMLFVLVLFTNAIVANAVNTGFSTGELAENDKNIFLSNVHISVLEEEPPKQSIVCFDVNADGKIAVGFSNSENKKICVYNQSEFLYGYEFSNSGDFGIEWDGENINIYFVRSDVIITVAHNGDILDIAEVQNTVENNTYRNFLLHSAERFAGDTRYSLRNDMGVLNFVTSSYSQLIATDADEKETILYDVNSAQLAKTVTVCVLVVMFVAIAVTVVIKQFKTKVKPRKNNCFM